MNINIASLREKVNTYKQVLANTRNYRQEWKDKTRQFIKKYPAGYCTTNRIESFCH